MIWFILFLALMVLGCYCTYKTAEVHELHKMRAAFELKENEIKKMVSDKKNIQEFNIDYFNGEIEELEEIKAIIDKKIAELKNFDVMD